jgi:KilA-N domain
MSLQVLSHAFQGSSIAQFDNGYIRLTDLGQAAGKLVGHYLEIERTQAYLGVLSRELGLNELSRNPAIGKTIAAPSKGFSSLIVTFVGANYKELQGTWAHPRVALNFAAWCSPEFEVWVYGLVHQHLTQAIAKPLVDSNEIPKFDALEFQIKIGKFVNDAIAKNSTDEMLQEFDKINRIKKFVHENVFLESSTPVNPPNDADNVRCIVLDLLRAHNGKWTQISSLWNNSKLISFNRSLIESVCRSLVTSGQIESHPSATRQFRIRK